MNEPPSQNSWSKASGSAPVSVRPVPTSPQPPQPSKAFRVVYAILGTAAAVLTITIGIYVGALNAKPRIVVPTRPPVPQQNGFPLLKAATDKPLRDKEVGDAIARTSKKTWTLGEKRELIAANKTAIAATRNALSFPYVEENIAPNIDTEYPYYKKFRHMARVLTLAGNVAWEEGNQKEAADYYLDGVTIGRRVPNRTALIGRLVGIACEVISRRAIWNRLETMSPDVAMQCLTRLQALQTERVPYQVTLEEEKYAIQRMAVEAMEHPDRFLAMSDDGTPPTEEDKTLGQVMRSYVRVVPKKYVVDTAGKHMDKVIAQSKKAYINGNEELPLPKELFTSIVVPVVQKARLRYVVNETGDSLLRTALALRIYKARNGKYPADLSELVVAKILPSIPDDPFDMPGAPLHYQLLPSGKYLLYSLGPDGTDDNGKGIEVKSPKGKPSRLVELDSKGDMVAGWYEY